MAAKAIVTCACGRTYHVQPEFFGKRLLCRRCNRITSIPANPLSSSEAVFDVPSSLPATQAASGWKLISAGAAVGGVLVGFCAAEAMEMARSPRHADEPLPVTTPVSDSDNPSGDLRPSINVPLQIAPTPSAPISKADALREDAAPIRQDAGASVIAQTSSDKDQSPETNSPTEKPLPISDGVIAQTFDEAKELSRQQDRPILLLFASEDCSWCQKSRTETLIDAAVRQITKKFLFVVMDVNDRSNAALRNRYGVKGLPTYVVTDSDGEIIQSLAGFQPEPTVFADWLNHPEVWRAMRERKTMPRKVIKN
jgi:thioredoxin-related protein